MLKEMMFIAITGLIILTGCAKNYNCECVTTTIDSGGMEVETTTSYTIKDTRVKAMNRCLEMDNTEDYVCKIN